MQSDRPGTELLRDMLNIKLPSLVELYLVGGQVFSFKLEGVSSSRGLLKGSLHGEDGEDDGCVTTFRASAVAGYVIKKEDKR